MKGWRRWLIPAVVLCVAPSPCWAEARDHHTLQEGLTVLLPKQPIEKCFVTDPEVAEAQLTPASECIVTGLRQGVTWLFFWFQGTMEQWEITVTPDPIRIERERFNLARVRRARWGLQNAYQLEISSQFSDQERPHAFRYSHGLDSFLPIKGSKGSLHSNMRWQHAGTERPNLTAFSAGLGAPHLSLNFGDVAVGGGEALVTSGFNVRGFDLRFHNFIATKDPEETMSLQFFGGLETTGRELFLPPLDTGGRAFGTSWQHMRGTRGSESAQVVIFRPSLGSPHYQLMFSEAAGATMGPVKWQEGFTWSGDGFASRANVSLKTGRVGESVGYAYGRHGLKGMRGSGQTNDVHTYSVGLSEELIRGVLWLRQNFAHSLTLSRPTAPVMGRTYSGGNGLLWKPNVTDTFSFNYTIHDSVFQGGVTALDQQSHQAALLHTHRFPIQLNLPSQRVVISELSYQATTRGVPLQSLSVSSQFADAKQKTFWNVGFAYRTQLSPTADHQLGLSGTWNTRGEQWSLQTGSTLRIQKAAGSSTDLSQRFSTGASWMPWPRHQFQSTVDASIRLHPWGSGPHVTGGTYVTYAWQFGPGVGAPPLWRGGKKRGETGERDVVVRVFHDTNHNEERDANESGIPNISVKLSGGESLTTGTDGVARFRHISPGSYEVLADTGNLPSTLQLNSPNPTPITVSLRESGRVEVGFALAEKQASILAAVFDDLNHNGDFDLSDGGVAGVVLRMRQGPEEVTCKTGRYGYCRFFPPATGVATVEAQTTDLPEDLDLGQLRGEVVVEEPKEYRVLFFANVKRAIQGRVIWDKNSNGRLDQEDAPLPMAVIAIGPYRVAANQEGEFTLRDIPPGTYPIRLLGGVPKGGRLPLGLQEVTVGHGGGVTTIVLPVRGQ